MEILGIIAISLIMFFLRTYFMDKDKNYHSKFSYLKLLLIMSIASYGFYRSYTDLGLVLVILSLSLLVSVFYQFFKEKGMVVKSGDE